MEETEVVRSYFDWNDALRRHFLTESDASVKLLCVDDDVLDEIGERYGIEKPDEVSFHNHFRTSVALSSEERLELLSFLRDGLRCIIPRGNGTSLFQIADKMARTVLPDNTSQRYDLPSLAFTALFILLCSNNRDPKSAIIRSLSEYTGNPEGEEERGFDRIPTLLSSIGHYDHSFDNNRRGSRPNVGRLQYQRVLSQRELGLFKRFLYSYNITLDESVSSYEDLMNYHVLGHMRGEYGMLYDRIVNANRNEFRYEDYFVRQIQNFDRERYVAELAGAGASPQTIGSFFLVVDFSSGSPLFSIYTDIAVVRPLNTNYGIIPPTGDSPNGLYPTNIRYGSLDTYCALRVENNDYLITSGPGRFLIFRERSDNVSLVQTYTPEPSRCYFVFVRRNDRNSIEALIRQQEAYVYPYFEGLFGNNWIAYKVDHWRVNRRERAIVRSSPSIKAGPGVAVPGERDVFFDKGLPSIIAPENLGRSILVERDVIGREAGALGRSLTRRGEQFFIDLDRPNGCAELPIRVKNIRAREVIDAYKVVFPQIDQNPPTCNESFVYDGWNRVCINRVVPSLEDNHLVHCCDMVYNTRNSEPKRKLSSTEEKSIRFIELLRASYLQRGFLLRKEITEIVNYLAGYYGLPQVEDKCAEYEHLISFLLIFGFLNQSYDDSGKSVFQLASPRLFPMGGTAFVLYGSFIESQISSIRNLTPSFFFVPLYSDRDLDGHPYLVFVPHFLVVSLNDQQIGFVRRLGISVESISLSDRILSIVKSPQEFSEDFLTDDNCLNNDYYQEGVSYPRIARPFSQWRFEDGHNVYESYKPDNLAYRKVPIPSALMWQYYRFLSQKPVCLVDECSGTMAFLDDMPVPFLFKKCLSYLNFGLPNTKRVFGLDGSLGVELTHLMFEYDVRTEDQMIIAKKLSGTDNPNMIRYKTYISRRYELYYVKSKGIYDPYQVHVFFIYNRAIPYAFAKKLGDSYAVFLLSDNHYYRLNYPSAAEAISAVLNDDPALKEHTDHIASTYGPLMDDAIERKERITILTKR